MREVPGISAPQLEAGKHQVTRFHEVWSRFLPALEDRAKPAAALVRHRAPEGGWRKADQVLETFVARRVSSQPFAND